MAAVGDAVVCFSGNVLVTSSSEFLAVVKPKVFRNLLLHDNCDDSVDGFPVVVVDGDAAVVAPVVAATAPIMDDDEGIVLGGDDSRRAKVKVVK